MSSTTSCTRSAAPTSRQLDRAAATAVAHGAAAAGAQQVVYLGGLGEDRPDLSPHLRSRAETAAILTDGSVPVTALRAAMIVGPGSAAFETILALVDRLPVMVCPRWVSVETQPVALADVARCARRRLRRAGRLGETFDLGGPEVMTYRTMMERAARLRGKHPVLIEVPFLTPRLSSALADPLATSASVRDCLRRASGICSSRTTTTVACATVDDLRRAITTFFDGRAGPLTGGRA